MMSPSLSPDDKGKYTMPSPMVQFKVLSNTFDQESKIPPSKGSRAKSIYKRYDHQLKKLEKLGVDKTKQEQFQSNLCDLLHETKDMT